MIKLDWTLLVQAAIFLSFLVYLNVYLLRPLRRYLERRQETIEGLRAAGGDQEAELETLQSEYSRKIAGAHDELLSQRSAARKEMMDIQSSLIEEARKEAHLELSRAEDELAGEVRKARETLAAESRALASMISSKILGRAFQ